MCCQFASAAKAVGGVVLIVLCASNAGAAADIEILNQSGTSLSVQFTDAVNDEYVLAFSRPTANDLWEANVADGEAGIIFGETTTQYAGTSKLRTNGISATQAVQTFESSIANRPFDDVTIFRLYAGDIAIALWQENWITEIWFVGSWIDDILIPAGPEDTCQLSVNACCRINNEGTGSEYPWPTNSACVAVINGCGTVLGDEACDCLSAACAFCNDGTPSPLCQDIPGLEDRSSQACTDHTNMCPLGVPTPAVNAATELLGEILDRAQVVRDIENP